MSAHAPTRPTETTEQRVRREALEDAARAAEQARMPDGDGPITLLEVRTNIAAAIRRLR